MRTNPSPACPYRLVFALLAFACAAAVWTLVAPRAHARAPQGPNAQGGGKAEEAKSTVRGRAVYAGTDRPVRRARVMLLRADGRGSEHAALTDGRGEFAIRNVPAGSYFAAVDAPGVISPVSFVPVEEMRDVVPTDEVRKHFDEVVIDGKRDVQLTVEAVRGAAISGKVTHPDGEPAVNLLVHIMRRREGRMGRVLTGIDIGALAQLHTDDRGIYRVAGLPTGEYFVSVSERVEHGEAESDRGFGFGEVGVLRGLVGQQLLMTFYPSATSVKAATAVNVEAGDEREGVDITLAERALRTVAGVARGRRDKRPVVRASVMIVSKEDSGFNPALGSPGSEMGQNSTRADEEGRWQLRDIPDGDYTITVNPPEEYETGSGSGTTNAGDGSSAPTAQRRRRRFAPLRRDVSVSGSDAELVLELSEGGQVSGRVTVEGGKSLPQYGISINAVPASTEGDAHVGMELSPGVVNGGQFTIEGLPPGKYFLRPSAYSSEGKSLYVKSINWRGRNLLREPLEVGESAQIEGVSVVYGSDPATLNVRAVGADKSPARDAYVILVPVETAERAPDTQKLDCLTSEDGACSITAAPGEYALVALPSERVEGRVEAEIRRRAAGSPRVTLAGGESKTMEIVVPGR